MARDSRGSAAQFADHAGRRGRSDRGASSQGGVVSIVRRSRSFGWGGQSSRARKTACVSALTAGNAQSDGIVPNVLPRLILLSSFIETPVSPVRRRANPFQSAGKFDEPGRKCGRPARARAQRGRPCCDLHAKRFTNSQSASLSIPSIFHLLEFPVFGNSRRRNVPVRVSVAVDPQLRVLIAELAREAAPHPLPQCPPLRHAPLPCKNPTYTNKKCK